MSDNTPAAAHEPVPPQALRWRCDPAGFPFADTSELEPHREIIGQDRALRALELGLEMDAPGYNIFLAGFVGTGRNTTVRTVLEKLDRGTEPPPDLCYVYNFADPDRPRAIFLAAGKGRRLASRMKLMVRRVARDLPQVFEDTEFLRQRQAIAERYKTRQTDVIQAFEKKAEAVGFALVQVQAGPVSNPVVLPVVDGEPRMFSDLEAESPEAAGSADEQLQELRERHKPLAEELQTVVRDAIRIEAEMLSRFGEHARESATAVVSNSVAMVREELGDSESLPEWLDQVQEDVLDHLGDFVGGADGSPAADEEQEETEAGPEIRYAVNVVVDNTETSGAPVIVENMPTPAQLFGMLERKMSPQGEAPVDHMRVKAGSLHQANGGYLVLNANDVFHEAPFVWNTLKRTLRTGRLEIPAVALSVLGPPALRPEPVCIEVKVVLIGDIHTYTALHQWDEDFRKIFKVRADFDTEMPAGERGLVDYARFVQRIVEEEKLAPFGRSAVARIAEYGVRLSGRRDRLSTRFNLVADIVREAAYFARRAGENPVTDTRVTEALEAKVDRNNLAEEKMQEMIEEGSVFIDVDGAKIGEVNGLAVYETGEYAFGLPAKITASVSMGNAGIINIEREADLSGRTHDKGVQILSGYIRAKYAQEKPLTLSASIAFEQSYHGVDGDSASSTELYAILSALSDLPLRQDLAVTGSVNQIGQIQPIGGVNEKIEGFFDICVRKGLTGTQGVLIPQSNVVDLMLHARVVEAVREGSFRIMALTTIDDGMEILTGVAAGSRLGKRAYPHGTVNGKVDLRLRELARAMREYHS